MDKLKDKLEVLEKKIDKVLGDYKELQRENIELKDKLKELESKIGEYEKEKALVIEKIESLVNRI